RLRDRVRPQRARRRLLRPGGRAGPGDRLRRLHRYLHRAARPLRGAGQRQPGRPARLPVAPQRPNVCASSRTFKPTIRTATADAATVVRRVFASAPIRSRLLVNTTSGTSANGIPNERITWLKTSVREGSAPATTAAKAGAIVTSRRSAIGI